MNPLLASRDDRIWGPSSGLAPHIGCQIGCPPAHLSRRVWLGLIGSLLRILAPEDSVEPTHSISVEGRQCPSAWLSTWLSN
jgi:hypothetical protein